MSKVFAILKWGSLGFGIVMLAAGGAADLGAPQEMVAVLISCFFILLAIFFQLEQHRRREPLSYSPYYEPEADQEEEIFDPD